MKLYAAFTEYGAIMWDMIRATEEEVIAAMKVNPRYDHEDLFAGGMGIAEFDAPTFSNALDPNNLTKRWTKGGWAK